MAVQKNFVVKNGIEVDNNLIFADKDQSTVGIGTTLTPEKLQVNGGIGATSIVVTGIGTFPILKSPNALISNGYINVGIITTLSGTLSTYTTSNATTLNATTGNILTGIVTTLSGTTATYTNANVTILNAGTVLTPNLYAVSGVVTSISGSSLNYTDLSGSSLNLTGIATIGVAGIGTLNVSGISTLSNLTVTPVGSGATVGSYSGIVTYYGDGSGLFNTPPGSAAGSDTQVQFNTGGAFDGSSNFTFDGYNVVVGSAVTLNPTGIVVSGITSAIGFAGTFRGGIAVFENTTTEPVVRITQTGTGNALIVEDSTNPDASPFVVTGIGSVGVGTNAPINTLDVHGTIRAARQDAVSDGGEIVFARASDNANAWSLDVHTNYFRITDIIAGSSRVNIGSGGNVGIGSTVATSKLHVFGDAIVTGIITSTSAVIGSGVTISSGGINVTGVVTSTSSVVGSAVTISSGGINVTGVVTSTSSIVGSAVTITSGGVLTVGVVTATDFNSTSDINLKENITTVDNALDITNQLRGVRFEWKKDHKPSYGVIAQELEQILPELVTNTDPKTVNYNGIIGVLIEAIKELKNEIEELKKL